MMEQTIGLIFSLILVAGFLCLYFMTACGKGLGGVPGMDSPYPATEPDEDSRYEHEREAAAEAHEGWR